MEEEISQKPKTINIYCDESGVENPEKKYMVIGSIFFERKEKERLLKQIKNIKLKYNFKGEIKWRKISKKYFPLYKELIEHFFSEPSYSFRCIVVEKEKIDMEKYHNNDLELAFYKYYYLMLKNIFNSFTNYYIFLDKRLNKDTKRLPILTKFLDIYTQQDNLNSNIKKLQSYDSKENIFIQLADIFTGSVNYSYSKENKSNDRIEFIKYIANKLGKEDLVFSSNKTEKKFNIFKINLS